jgi:hypothetical protein
MLGESDRKFLFRAISANRCLLFVGAGFSREAQNALAKSIPDGQGLAKDLWSWLRFDGDFDDSPLSEVYEAALRSGRSMADLKGFLEERLLAVEVPDWYRIPTDIYWFRMYSTNADNVVESSFRQRGGAPEVSCVNAVVDDYEDRDQFLRTIQYIKLNGSLPGRPEGLTFSTREYARRSAQFDQWYDHFVRDYTFHPTIFVGSELREPLFWQAIEARQARGKNPEERPRSFLIAPSVSPAKLPILQDLNIVHVRARACDFFTWLRATYDFPDRGAVLRLVAPEAVEFLLAESLSTADKDAFAEFLTSFPRVPQPASQQARARTYFLGVAPRWEDIATDFDAPRILTKSLLEAVEAAWHAPDALAVFGVVGTGGSGKSTILMRAAFALRQGGRQVFFSEGSERPEIDAVVAGLDRLNQRAVLFVDNAHLFGPLIHKLLRAVANCKRPPVIVFGARLNVFERQLKTIAQRQDSRVFEVDDLADEEITALIATLGRYAQLGHLADKTEDQRFSEFKLRAKKQILVAMREATEGYGFDEIVRNEFAEIDNREARILFICAAVATAELIDLTREQWLACAEVAPAEALAIFASNLRGLLLQDERGRVAARHSIIAELIVDRIAERTDVSEAYVRLLNTIAHDIYSGPGRATRTWRLFVRLIDHKRIFLRFAHNLELARSIYLSVAQYFTNDGHFWLQFANLEIEYGEARNARPHLAHAEALMPEHRYVLTTKAHLALRESFDATSIEDAMALRKEAEEILLTQIRAGGAQDEYPYHVYVNRMLRWVEMWVTDRAEKRKELEKLYHLGQEAVLYHGYSRRIRDVAESARRAYLGLAVRDGASKARGE